MFTIDSPKWDKIKFFWEKWRIYDVTVGTHNLNIQQVYTDLVSLDKYEREKVFGFYKDDVLMGCGIVKDFTCHWKPKCPEYKIAGIANMAVNQAYRNNGIGTALMVSMIQYMKLQGIDLSILYPSIYSRQFNFYNQFGYIPYKKVMLKYFNQVDLSTDSLDRIIKSIGKF